MYLNSSVALQKNKNPVPGKSTVPVHKDPILCYLSLDKLLFISLHRIRSSLKKFDGKCRTPNYYDKILNKCSHKMYHYTVCSFCID